MEQLNVLSLAGPPTPVSEPTPRGFRTLALIDRPESRFARLAAALVAVVIAAAFFWVVLQYWAPAHPGVDQSGYLMGGKQLAATGSTGLKPAHPLGFVSNMYVRNDATGINYPKYPVGLPLLYAIFLWTCGTLGPKAAHLVSPIGMGMAVLGTYFLARRFAGTFASLAGMIILATSPVVLLLADNPNSHASCLAFCVWGAFFLVRFWETASIWRGLLGGFMLGYAVTIRYPEGVFGAMIGWVVLSGLVWPFARRRHLDPNRDYATLIQEARPRPTEWLLPIGVAVFTLLLAYKLLELTDVGFGVRVGIVGVFAAAIAAVLGLLLYKIRNFWRPLTPALGWAIPVAALVLFNRIAMGTWTGYDTTNESVPGQAFTLEHFYDNWELFTRKIHDTGLFFSLPLGVLGMALAVRYSVRRGMLLWLWLVPGAAVYLSYYWAPENGLSYLRFLITLLPPLAVGAAVTFDVALASAFSPWSRLATPVAVGLVVVAASSMGLYRGLLRLDTDDRVPISMESQLRQELNLSALADVVVANVPKGSVFFAQTAPLHAIQFLGDYECFDVDYFRGAFAGRMAALAVQKEANPDDPNPMQPQRVKYLHRVVGNKNDEQLAQVQTKIITAALDDRRRVFFLATKNETAAYVKRFDKPALGLQAKTVATFTDLPRPPKPEDTQPAADPKPPAPPGRRGPNAGPPPARPNRGFRAGARQNNANWADNLPVQTWQIIEVKRAEPKKPSPAPAAVAPAKPAAPAKVSEQSKALAAAIVAAKAKSAAPTTKPAATKPTVSRPPSTRPAAAGSATRPAVASTTRPTSRPS